MIELWIVGGVVTIVALAAILAMWSSNRAKDKLVKSMVSDVMEMASEFKDAALCWNHNQLERLQVEVDRDTAPLRSIVRDDAPRSYPEPVADTVVGNYTEAELEEFAA